jgi:hypothetical protein
MRSRTLFLLSLTCAACGQGDLGNLVHVVDGATLASVSQGQKYIAWYTGAAMLASGGTTGTLAVAPLPGMQPQMLDAGAFNAAFNHHGQVLLYSTDQVASTDRNSNEIYGALHLWSPGMSGGARLTAGYAILQAAPPDNSFVLIFDGAKPTNAQQGTVLLVRASDCSGASCGPVTLASSVAVHSMIASLDGRWAAYVVRRGLPAMAQFETWLVSVPDGKVTMMGTTSATLTPALVPMAISPDGALFACTAELAMAPLQLQVFSTASLQPVAWTPLPAGTNVIGLEWSDANTLLARVATVPGVIDGPILRTGAAPARASRLVPSARYFYVPYFPTGANRYLFVQTTDTNDVGDAQVYDLEAAMPAPLSLANATVSFRTEVAALPTLSDDLQTIRLFDQYDPATRAGRLTVASLPSGALSGIASGDGAAAFVPGSSTLLYIDQPDASNAGLLASWKAGTSQDLAGGVANFRVRSGDGGAPGTLYFTLSEPDPTASPPLAAGIYAEPAPR